MAATSTSLTCCSETIDNLKEATELYLEEFPSVDVSRPILTTFDAVVNG